MKLNYSALALSLASYPTLPAWMIDALKREEEARERARDAARPRVYVELPREPEKKTPEKTRWL